MTYNRKFIKILTLYGYYAVYIYIYFTVHTAYFTVYTVFYAVLLGFQADIAVYTANYTVYIV